MSKPPIIRFENVTKAFGKVIAVDDVTLDIPEGEFFALLGPSGCGKTSLLRLLAGFETPTQGRILIDGDDVSRVPPNRRPVNMVFQNYAVFPHMSVAQNVGYGLKVDGVAADERAARVADALALVKLEGLGARTPEQLSGGQRQRVALARALIKRPRVLLLDEPLSALDARLRDAMRAELTQLQQKIGITFVMVTHDQHEALAMACRCGVMDQGRLQQVATPNDLYEYPTSRFVADFIGQVNLFESRVEADLPDHAIVTARDLDLPVWIDHGVNAAPGTAVCLALRPEKIELHKRGDETALAPRVGSPSGYNQAAGTIRHINYLGSTSTYDVELASGRMVTALRSNLTRRGREDFALGEAVWLAWHAASPVVLPA